MVNQPMRWADALRREGIRNRSWVVTRQVGPAIVNNDSSHLEEVSENPAQGRCILTFKARGEQPEDQEVAPVVQENGENEMGPEVHGIEHLPDAQLPLRKAERTEQGYQMLGLGEGDLPIA